LLIFIKKIILATVESSMIVILNMILAINFFR